MKLSLSSEYYLKRFKCVKHGMMILHRCMTYKFILFFGREAKKQNLKGTLKYIYCGIYKVYLNICRYHHAGWQARHYCPPQWVLIDLGGEATKSLHFVKVNFCFCSEPHFTQQGATTIAVAVSITS